MKDASTRPLSDCYGKLLEEFAGQIGEKPTVYDGAQQNVREEIVRCLWFGSHFNPDELTTDDGRRIEVLAPGWWNVEGGPDFIRAEFLLEGVGRVSGDVEVHTHASSWFAHGHDKQPEYNGVALHVVMWNDLGGREVRLQSGSTIPQLTLSRFVEEEIGELVEIIDLEQQTRPELQPAGGRFCSAAIASGQLDLDWLGQLLDCAGDHRILTKVHRMSRLLDRQPREQALYEALAEALGYKNNRMPFLQLAGLVPLKTLREIVPLDASAETRRETVEGILYGASGLLDDEPGAGADAETEAYVARLRKVWQSGPAWMWQAQMTRAHWTFAGTRPVNYPTRRIAALACIYAEHLEGGLFSHMEKLMRSARPGPRRSREAAVRGALTGFFTGIEHPYWSRRHTFGGRRLAAPLSLVGAERAAAILIDVLIPLMLAHARARQDDELAGLLHALWRSLPCQEPNSVVRRMCRTLFPSGGKSFPTIDSARRQQGLHQLYKDFCHSPEGCRSCVLYLAHKAGRKLMEV
jgi:hypothetical protein